MEPLSIIRDFARTIARRFVLFFLLALAGTFASIYYALGLERVYEAVAVVQIQAPQLSSGAAGDAAGASMSQRIQRIEQQLRSRDSLVEVADKFDLFAPGQMPLADRARLMWASIWIESVAGIQGSYGLPPEPSALIIRARLAEAEKAAAVANEFVARLLERNQRDREQRTAEALRFFQREERRLGQELAEIDDRILQHKYENAGSLAEGLEFRRDELVRLDEDHLDISRQVMALERESAMLEQVGIRPRGVTITADPISVELSRLQIELARKTVATPNHPDLSRLKLQITALEDNESQIRRRLTANQRQLIEEEVDLLRMQLASIAARKAILEELIQASPAVELELSRLTRDRAHLQRRLDAATEGRSAAEVERQLETNHQSERFEVLEDALVPQFPVGPSRKKSVLAGSGASILLGGLIIYALEILNPVIRSSARFRRYLGKAPTISLPYISTTWERRRRRLIRTVALLLVIGGIPMSLAFVDQYVWPFEEMAKMFEELSPSSS